MNEHDWFRVGNSATAIAALAEEARKDPTKGTLTKIMIEQHLHSITLNLHETK
jgi:predicted regulator of Ras-like GTPase activity (Roadblock/LC7/MglB family)